MKNRLAAFSRRIIPYNPEFRRLPLVKSVNAALLLQQLDFWFDKYSSFWKFIETAPNHSRYKEGDSWTEELGFSKEEFRTAFSQIGVVYKSKSQFVNAKNKFVENGVEHYYASYYDRKYNLTFYYRNDELLDRELMALVDAQDRKPNDRPERPIPEVDDEPQAPVINPVTAPATTEAPKPAKARKRTPEEIAADKAKKEEEKRLRKEEKARLKREKQEQIDRDNADRYNYFGSKERYLAFNGWFWGTYIPGSGSQLDNPGMFYTAVFNNFLAGGEKFRHILSAFEAFERKQAQEAKVEQEQKQLVSNDDRELTDDDYIAMYSMEEVKALHDANLDKDVYSQLLRHMQHQTHKMRMQSIQVEKDLQEVRNYRKRRAEGQA